MHQLYTTAYKYLKWQWLSTCLKPSRRDQQPVGHVDGLTCQRHRFWDEQWPRWNARAQRCHSSMHDTTVLQRVLSAVSVCVCRTSSVILAPIKSRMETFWWHCGLPGCPGKWPLNECIYVYVAVICSGNALVLINAVALHRARLVLGWVTAFG